MIFSSTLIRPENLVLTLKNSLFSIMINMTFLSLIGCDPGFYFEKEIQIYKPTNSTCIITGLTKLSGVTHLKNSNKNSFHLSYSVQIHRAPDDYPKELIFDIRESKQHKPTIIFKTQNLGWFNKNEENIISDVVNRMQTNIADSCQIKDIKIVQQHCWNVKCNMWF